MRKKTKEPANVQEGEKRARINSRPLLFCALGTAFGILLYARCRFGGFSFSDFILFALLLVFAYLPVSLRRVLLVTLPFVLFALFGALSAHLYTENFLRGPAEGTYEISGTVESFSVRNGYTRCELGSLTIDGDSCGGILEGNFPSEEIRAGDRLFFTAELVRSVLPANGEIGRAFIENIRYTASSASLEKTEDSCDLFLRFNGALYDVLHKNMPRNEADVSYALLTGNSSVMEYSLSDAVRKGGIAHIFAVSGLHIGILYAAVSLALRPLGRWRFLPASALSLCYCAVCGFSVSSVRAVIMCFALGLNGALGRKSDFIQSLSFAAVVVLFLNPAQWFGAGFRLSFGACAGLALFSGSLSRGMKKFPSFLRNYCSANFSVQIFTFPVLVDCFGYFSVWGTVLNFFLIPCLPVLFLCVLACSVFALIVAPAAHIFLALPAGLVSALLFLLSAADFTYVLTGFTLGAASAVFTVGCVFLSERVRLGRRARAALAAGIGILFCLIVVMENVVFFGCRINAGENMALVRTPHASVLVVGEGATLSSCTDFLARTYGGRLDAVAVLGEDESALVNVAAFLPAKKIYARREIQTGLRETEILFCETFEEGELSFRYEGAEKLSMLTRYGVTEFDFYGSPALGADLFVGRGQTGLIFYLENGMIYSR